METVLLIALITAVTLLSLRFVRLQRERSFSFLPLIIPANLEVLDKHFPFVPHANCLWFAVRLKDVVLLSLELFCSPRQFFFFFFGFLPSLWNMSPSKVIYPLFNCATAQKCSHC